jgi:ribonuclease BN (tRNA processing enzyme)
VLVHEAYPLSTFAACSPAWQDFRRTHHTSSKQLAEIARRVKPRLLVVYHHSNAGGGPLTADTDDVLLAEIREGYDGAVEVARDLDIF